MQMSVERFREVHKLIWGMVISHADEVKKGVTSVVFLKNMGVNHAYKAGLLDSDEVDVIDVNSNCMLCSSCYTCQDCILNDCRSYNSLYKRATRGDIVAMKEILNVVDKWPYTILSTITLK